MESITYEVGAILCQEEKGIVEWFHWSVVDYEIGTAAGGDRHDSLIGMADAILADYNRCDIPRLEISMHVSAPARNIIGFMTFYPKIKGDHFFLRNLTPEEEKELFAYIAGKF